jgi:cytochrome c2
MKKNIFVICLLFVGCTLPKKEQNVAKQDTVTVAAPLLADQPVSADSMSISLEALKAKGLIKILDTMLVTDDPVFHGKKTYYGLSFRQVLAQFTALKKIDIKNTQIVFECEDGYNPSMALEKLLSRNSFLALADASAPKGEAWVEIKKGEEIKKVAPFYLVYNDVTPQEHVFKWPYNLVRIRLVPVSEELKALFPKGDELAVKGYDLFRLYCLTCHAINQVGGKMGPELNAPKSITEYWHIEDIKAFVKNPSSYRHGVKMPAQTYISDREIDEIIYYLSYMAKHR